MAVLKVVVGHPLMQVASPVVTSWGHPGTAAHSNGGHVSQPLCMCVCVCVCVFVCDNMCVCVSRQGDSPARVRASYQVHGV